jgi:hypothetical protein
VQSGCLLQTGHSFSWDTAAVAAAALHAFDAGQQEHEGCSRSCEGLVKQAQVNRIHLQLSEQTSAGDTIPLLLSRQ